VDKVSGQKFKNIALLQKWDAIEKKSLKTQYLTRNKPETRTFLP
jgi:hypothetical protein